MFLRVIGSSPLPNSARRRPDEDKVAKIGKFASASFRKLKPRTGNEANGESGIARRGMKFDALWPDCVLHVTLFPAWFA
jgi:hypothetical protein